MIRLFNAPSKPTELKSFSTIKIFLAGTIDMGNSKDWQTDMVEHIDNTTYSIGAKHKLLDIYNPRRPDWDSSWQQVPENKEFKRQVLWQLDQLDKADVILMCLMPKSKSPISLLELGLFHNKRILVYNPKEFYRYGNVQLTCYRYKIPVYHDWQQYLRTVTEEINLRINLKAN